MFDEATINPAIHSANLPFKVNLDSGHEYSPFCE